MSLEPSLRNTWINFYGNPCKNVWSNLRWNTWTNSCILTGEIAVNFLLESLIKTKKSLEKPLYECSEKFIGFGLGFRLEFLKESMKTIAEGFQNKPHVAFLEKKYPELVHKGFTWKFFPGITGFMPRKIAQEIPGEICGWILRKELKFLKNFRNIWRNFQKKFLENSKKNSRLNLLWITGKIPICL